MREFKINNYFKIANMVENFDNMTKFFIPLLSHAMLACLANSVSASKSTVTKMSLGWFSRVKAHTDYFSVS